MILRPGPLAAVLLPALLACTPGASRGAAQESVVGRVAVSGSAPMDLHVTLHPAGGSSLWLTGTLQAELARLAGAQVEVRGRREGGTVVVDSYRLVSVDGRPALVGRVEAAPGGGLQLRTDEGRTVRLGAPPAELRPGQKVWVQGPGEAQVQVQTFGVITP